MTLQSRNQTVPASGPVNRELRMLQETHDANVRHLVGLRFLQGVVALDVPIDKNGTTVYHGLGRKPQGWLVIRTVSESDPGLYTTPNDWEARDDEKIEMRGDGNNADSVVDILFF